MGDTGEQRAFTSRYRKTDAAEKKPRGNRRVFDTESRESIRSTLGSAKTEERTESPTPVSHNDDTDSVVSKMNKLNTNEKGSDEERPKKDEDEDEESSSRSKKKSKDTSQSSRKRAARKNLREKRRSTGVVIMPGQAIAPADEEERIVQENTAKNMDEEAKQAALESQKSSAPASGDNTEIQKQLEAYEQAIEEWKDAYEKAQKEIDSLRNDNMRLKDENSALLRVVGSLSGTGGGHRR